MATKSLGTNTTSSLTAVSWLGGPVSGGSDVGLSASDIAAINALILSPNQVVAGAAPTGTTTTSSASISSISSTSRIQAGMLIFGSGIPPGTAVASVNIAGSSLVMTAAITGSGAGGVQLLIVPPTGRDIAGLTPFGLLYVPGRGVLQVRAGDYVGVDASGWPILVSSEAITYANTSWTHS